MARRKRKSSGRSLLLLAVLAIVGAALWVKRDATRQWLTQNFSGRTEPNSTNPVEPSPQNVSGELIASGPVRDGQLGVSANAAVLFRHVEMYQWQEHCDGACRYDQSWSAPVDSRRFRDPKGHENPQAPFNDSVFFAPGLKLAGHPLDLDLLVGQLPNTAYAAHGANLPLNLAATFAERDGVLYAGGDPAHPAIGELRISYRIIPIGPTTLNGVVRGGKLVSH
jgi:hypothetical protein